MTVYQAIYEGRRRSSTPSEPIQRDRSRVAPTRVPVGGSACRPFLKIERDQAKFAACQKIAEDLGEIDTPDKAFKILLEAVGGNVAEKFGILTLDTHLHMRGIWETGAGETDSTMAPTVPTLHAAITDMSAAVVAWHLHPAASDYPSDSDIELTKNLNAAFTAIDILMMDHVIIAAGSKKGFYSFLESMPKTLETHRR